MATPEEAAGAAREARTCRLAAAGPDPEPEPEGDPEPESEISGCGRGGGAGRGSSGEPESELQPEPQPGPQPEPQPEPAEGRDGGDWLDEMLFAKTPHEDLFRHASVCARVCREWRKAATRCPAYLHGHPHRALMLRHMSKRQQLGKDHSAFSLMLGRRPLECLPSMSPPPMPAPMEGRWKDRQQPLVARAVGATLAAMPSLTRANLDFGDWRVEELPPLFAGLTQGFHAGHLTALNLDENPSMGDAGMELLSASLPKMPGLETLALHGVGCGSGGMVALARGLPQLKDLAWFFCGGNPAIGLEGWDALVRTATTTPRPLDRRRCRA